MSRRGRHGRPPNTHAVARPTRPAAAASERPATAPEARPADARAPEPRTAAPVITEQRLDARTDAAGPAADGARAGHLEASPAASPIPAPAAPVLAVQAATSLAIAAEATPADGNEQQQGSEPPRPTTCTTAQLRRFIKSRPWVPMHELRRRFGIWGDDDDVTPIHVGDHTLFVGLPPAEGSMVAELLSGGDVGYELSLDPITPVIVGVYPMRPVPRS